MSKLIGISGVAGAGKDTLLELLRSNLPTQVKHFALADDLKRELQPKLLQKYNVDILNCSREEKNKVRHELVNYARDKRIATSGRYWTEKLQPKIENYRNENPKHYIIITDIRHAFYPRDEHVWLKEEMRGILVHVSRYQMVPFVDFQTKSSKMVERIIPPFNADEKEHDPRVMAKANFKIKWPTVRNSEGDPDLKHLNIYAEELIKYIHR
jgi:hypothetical protein